MNRDIDKALSGAKPDTLAVRAGQCRTGEDEHAEALFLTSSYAFESAAQAAARFCGDEPGNVYSRYTNPTVRNFEQRIAALEGAEDAVATSSGMAAVLSTCMALLKAGDHVVCSRSVFGATISLFGKYMEKFGVEVSFVSLTDIDEWRAAIRDNTALLWKRHPTRAKWPTSRPCKAGPCALLAVAAFAPRRCNAPWNSGRTLLFIRPPSTWTARAAASVAWC